MPLNLPLRSKGRPRSTPPQIRTTVISSDYHVPAHDVAAYKAVLNFIRDKRPDYHIIAGDLLDLYDQSRFAKDPRILNRTEEELDAANQILDELAEASPNTITKFLAGNHEQRLTRRLFENPDILPFATRSMNPDQLLIQSLSLEEREIEYFPYPDVYNHWGFLICHGQAVGLHPARKELERHGISGCSGHVHRNRYWERKDRASVCAWWSLGGLCTHDVDYNPHNDWQHGFGYLEQDMTSDLFTFHPIPIIKGKFMFGGKLYTQDGVFESL